MTGILTGILTELTYTNKNVKVFLKSCHFAFIMATLCWKGSSLHTAHITVISRRDQILFLTTPRSTNYIPHFRILGCYYVDLAR